MKKLTIILTIAVLTAVTAGAQERGRGAGTSASAVHSNAPTSTNRDKGKNRAEDVGRGKKKGLTKTRHSRHHAAASRKKSR